MNTATIPKLADRITSGPSAWVSHTAVMARRAIHGIVRQPQLWAPSLVFPLFFAAVSAAALDRTTGLPGFPEVDSFLTFILPATVLQGVMFSATSAGNETAIDIENGFLDRLLAAPVPRIPMFVGRLGGVMLLSLAQAIVFTLVFLGFGATFAAGAPGLAVLAIVGVLFGSAIGALSIAIALRTGAVEAVNGSFPIFFAAVFLSSAFFPPELSGGWFEVVANANPITWMIDAVRDLVISGWDAGSALTAIGVAGAMLVAFLAVALQALRVSLRS